MIRARFEGDSVTLSGHAGYAPRGEDIVCAAVSALVYVQTRLLQEDEALEALTAREGFVELKLRRGVRCRVLETGLRWLSAEYPRCVQVEKEEWMGG